MTVSFWLNQPVADDGSLKSNKTLVVGAVVVDGGVVVEAVRVVGVAVRVGCVVVVGAIVAVVATVVAVTGVVVVVASDAHALRREIANVVSNNFVCHAMTEFYHRFLGTD